MLDDLKSVVDQLGLELGSGLPQWAPLTSAGYAGQQAPYDAFWGARYAVVSDPDGNLVGLMSPADAAFRLPPPAPPD